MLSIFVCSFLRYTNVFIFKVYQFVPLFNKCTPELNYSSSQSISLHNLNMADTAVQYRRIFRVTEERNALKSFFFLVVAPPRLYPPYTNALVVCRILFGFGPMAEYPYYCCEPTIGSQPAVNMK